MRFLGDALKLLLTTDPDARKGVLAGIIGHSAGAEPTRLAVAGAHHVYHLPKPRHGSATAFALTFTVGLGGRQARELLAATLADQGPATPMLALLAAVVAANPGRGSVAPLPPGTLGRSSHDHVLVAEPWILREVPEYERLLAARLDLCVPVTRREAEWIAQRGADDFVQRMKEQGVGPFADRPAGTTEL